MGKLVPRTASLPVIEAGLSTKTWVEMPRSSSSSASRTTSCVAGAVMSTCGSVSATRGRAPGASSCVVVQQAVRLAQALGDGIPGRRGHAPRPCIAQLGGNALSVRPRHITAAISSASSGSNVDAGSRRISGNDEVRDVTTGAPQRVASATGQAEALVTRREHEQRRGARAVAERHVVDVAGDHDLVIGQTGGCSVRPPRGFAVRWYAARDDQSQTVAHRWFEAGERIDERLDVLAPLPRADGQDERAVDRWQHSPQCACRFVTRLRRREPRGHASADGHHTIRIDTEVLDRVEPRVLGDGDEEIELAEQLQAGLVHLELARSRQVAVGEHERDEVVDDRRHHAGAFDRRLGHRSMRAELGLHRRHQQVGERQTACGGGGERALMSGCAAAEMWRCRLGARRGPGGGGSS